MLTKLPLNHLAHGHRMQDSSQQSALEQLLNHSLQHISETIARS